MCYWKSRKRTFWVHGKVNFKYIIANNFLKVVTEAKPQIQELRKQENE